MISPTIRRCGVALAGTALIVTTWNSAPARLAAQDGHLTPVYRVNAGGPTVSGTPSWTSDTVTSPSPYTNAAAASSAVYKTSTAINMSDPSVPTGTPASLFQTERYDKPEGQDMVWSFPVTPGSYEVRLYFAEIFVTASGARVFNVAIEGDMVLQNYDIFADVGAFKGVVKSYTVLANSTLDIIFTAVVQSPKINAIEVLQAPEATSQLAALPQSVAFDSVLVGEATTRAVQITNAGASGDPDIDVYSTSITGPYAGEFSDNFPDGSTVTLAPGQSTTITVGFAPASAGAKSASLEISHMGLNHPLVIPLSGSGASVPPGTWQTRAASGLLRQEVAYVQLNGKFYLAGGGTAHEEYDPGTNTWSILAPFPVNLDHVQSVALGGRIYYIGGLLAWPQPAASTVYIYDPATDTMTSGAPMPRPRGAGGVAVYDGRIYYAGGLAGGTAVSWFDVYEPVANTWTALPDMPVARDHFHAAVIGGKFYVTGGRATTINALISSTIAYDFGTGTWQTTGLAPIPTPRGGFAAAVLGNEILVIGGEGGGLTFNTVEAYDTVTNTWRTMAAMPTARHGIQAAECNGGLYVAAGGTTQGGSTPTNVHEVFFLGSASECAGAAPPPPPPPAGVVYRVNAGGPTISATPNWTADTSTSPSPYSNVTAASSATFTTSTQININDPSVPAGTPAALFQSERYDPAAGGDMLWSFPVSPGTYEVRLYFAELFVVNPGERVFNVAIEGQTVLSNYDIYAEVGSYKGVVKSFSVMADTSLDIAFSRVVQNPKVSAIEIVSVSSAPGQLGASSSSVAFGDVVVGQVSSRAVQLTNLGAPGSPNIDIYSTTISGVGANQFDDDFNDAGTVTLTPGQAITLAVSFAPTTTGAKSAALEIAHTGSNSPLVIALSGAGIEDAPPPPSGVSYRVNAGGPAISATPNWTADTSTSPSPYSNVSAASSATYTTSTQININDPSIPAGTPAALFQTERYDQPAGGDMVWSFPVTPGQYEVRLYFAEIFYLSPGQRVFNVVIEGQAVLSNYDIYADVGSYKGVVKSFTVMTDTSLDIAFGRVIQNPKISAIEILDSAPRPNELGVSPTSLPFGNVTIGQNHAQTVMLTNLGGSGDPSIVVNSTTISGTHAPEFSDNFNDAVGVTLAPQQSTNISITFAPTSTGAKSASLQLAHSGVNSVAVALSGTGVDPTTSPGTWQHLAPSSIPRHETTYVHYNGKFYLAGDRGRLEHEVYDPVTNAWGFAAPLPAEFHHAQGVELNGLIYYLGGLVGPYPDHVTPAVNIYNPATNSWSSGTPMPAGRARGGGGTALYNDMLVVAGGLVDDASGTGHLGASTALFDMYDPVAGTWTVLPNMPRARDHFHAAVVGNKLYAIGGRKGGDVGFFNAVIAPVDIYDFTTGTWSTLPSSANIPTPRAGIGVAVIGSEVIVIGGEGNGNAYNKVEAFNTVTQTWRTMTPMPTARHGFQAAVCNGGIYVATGGLTQGGGSLTNIHQVFFPGGEATGCGTTAPPPPTPVGFGKTTLTGTTSLNNPTSLQFGPDGRLYVSQQNGLIRVYSVARNGANSYAVTGTEIINVINSVPNRNDDGVLNSSVTTRLITGILVVGTSANPVIYVAHSDPRIGGGASGADLNLDTNSSMISRLTWTGSTWQKLDLVRGLPRSEENHAANGMQLDPATNTLYVAMGGNTNKGATSNNFAYLPEFALSAAILSIDLNAIGNSTYDLPTLDDETRPGNPDANDPFGGNQGRNQAKLVPGGPVQVYAPGFRNAYDLVITRAGRMYAVDNGGNAGWGHIPIGEGPAGNCTNAPNEPGTTDPDSLHFITGPGYYGGHPNPTRGNMANTFNTTNPQSPVSVPNPVECDYRAPGATNGALATFSASTNGITEYTSNNFGGAMDGNLLVASWNGIVHRIQLNAAGTQASVSPLFTSVGSQPLDVVAQSPFPGTIWVALYGANTIVAFEPNDYGGSTGPVCTGAYDWNLDEDLDGYKNADEIDNGTNPCSAADVPPDWDGDFLSDLNDPDDDGDGIPDELDAFALDPLNGTATHLPVNYWWENDGTNPGGILNLGFTGLMMNGTSNYASQYDPGGMTAGGAAGVMTVDAVTAGDAYGAINTQQHGFQFGVRASPSDTGPFFAHTRILGPFAGLTPLAGQSMGLFVGTGDQDNYVKVVVSGTAGGGIAYLREVNGVPDVEGFEPLALPGPNYIDLYLRVDPARATVQPFYTSTTGGVTSAPATLAPPMAVPAGWFTNASKGLAVGVISTSRGSGQTFPVTWDFIRAVPSSEVPTLAVMPGSLAFGSVAVGDTKSLDVQLTNLGGADAANLTISGATLSGTGASHFSHTFGSSVSLAPGESTTVRVHFSPSATGTHTASLGISHSAGGTPFQVPLSGSGVAAAGPLLGASPSSLAFGNVTVGQTAALGVQLTNTGTTSLTVQGATVTGTDAGQFSTAFSSAVTLNAGASTTINVTFAPTSSGAKSASLSVTHTGGNSPLAVPLSGSGVAPSLPNLAASPTSLSFGSITVGQSAALGAQLTNTGTTSLTVQGVTITGADAGQFSTTFSSAVTLNPGVSTTLNVTFAPSSDGTKSAALSITHTGGNSPLAVPLSGSGVAPSLPNLAASPTSLSFGSVAVGQTASLDVQLTNTGSSDLVVQPPTLTGNGAAHYSYEFGSTSAITLPPGGSRTVTVTFAPTSNGSKNATLQVVHSGANTPVQVPLTGQGRNR